MTRVPRKVGSKFEWIILLAVSSRHVWIKALLYRLASGFWQREADNVFQAFQGSCDGDDVGERCAVALPVIGNVKAVRRLAILMQPHTAGFVLLFACFVGVEKPPALRHAGFIDVLGVMITFKAW